MLNHQRTRSQGPICEPIVGGCGLGLHEGGEWVAAPDTPRKI
jgi:hypothetical protein